ncbi:hypothetical protein [Psychrobium sp. 1_MG-2023]|uniref:hypothetical protein n=1 Tax=Psychrobium sp. 1_MG-2023 TaxID=3062624 RepID=UPI000C34C7D9|nr:hypothetical protein [Psychrobium sp. 1_MG-2023]MDP2561514.1 hypothetical protein [Psychrobium sp. 1_MG-2023]PKF54979.1 hypothetical protein CW748_14450 [Alteromonadales bacterium alter-6D02]
MKRKSFTIASLLFITACSSTVVPLGDDTYRITVVPLGDDTYRITKVANEALKTKTSLQASLNQEASEFCQSEKSSTNLKTIMTSSTVNHKNQLIRAELEFSC